MLATETSAARRRVPDAIRQTYSIVVTVNENNDVHAFKLVVTEEPLFPIIKADKRARIQETAISSEAMLPGGPYDLWREGERSRRIKDLVGAFAQYPRLPKMLRTREILETVIQGVRERHLGRTTGTPRPDGPDILADRYRRNRNQRPGLGIAVARNRIIERTRPRTAATQQSSGLVDRAGDQRTDRVTTILPGATR